MIWFYNGHPVEQSVDPRAATCETKGHLMAPAIEVGHRALDLTDPNDPIALARRLFQQLAERHMESDRIRIEQRNFWRNQ